MRTLVVGVGNEERGDDGLGPLVARLLAETIGPPGGAAAAGAARAPIVEFVAWTGDPLGLLDRCAGVDRLVLVDAVVSGDVPGTTRRYGPDAPFARTAGASTHGIGLAEALALGRTLGRLPGRIDVWGIEAAEFAPGAPLTPAVAEAVLALVARLGEELRAATPA